MHKMLSGTHSRHVPAERLSTELERQVKNIEPSVYERLRLYPSLVLLKSGRELDHVYIVQEENYSDYWGIYPEDDPQKKCVNLRDIQIVKESPSRLPARFANRLYEAGESGMGYHIFTVVFSDGLRQAYQTGNAVDFLQYPTGYGPTKVVEVLPHEGRESSQLYGAEYYWCLYA